MKTVKINNIKQQAKEAIAEVKQQATELWDSGYESSEIYALTGVTYTVLYRELKRQGVNTERKKLRAINKINRNDAKLR